MMKQEEVVTQWRNYFEDSGDNSRTYKLFIETAYGCHGSCQGCPIPLINRTSTEPKWELDNLSNLMDIFAKNLVNYRKDNGFEPIENLAITIGPAENLYFSPEYLKEMANLSKKFKKDIGAKNFHLAITTSGLFSEVKLIEKINALREVLNKDELSFAFIINLRQFNKTPDHYFRFAQFIFEHTNLVELEINMDQNVTQFTLEELQKFSQFVDSFPFIQLDFAYAINDGNVSKTFLKDKEFYQFIETLRNLSNAPLKTYFSQWHSKLNPIEDEDLDFYSNYNTIHDDIINKSIRLNSLGQWHFTKNILGTVYYDENFGFDPVALSSENPFSLENLSKFKKQLAQHFHKQLAIHQACSDCTWKNTCLNSGFLTFSKFSPHNETICSNPGYTIFKNITGDKNEG